WFDGGEVPPRKRDAAAVAPRCPRIVSRRPVRSKHGLEVSREEAYPLGVQTAAVALDRRVHVGRPACAGRKCAGRRGHVAAEVLYVRVGGGGEQVLGEREACPERHEDVV